MNWKGKPKDDTEQLNSITPAYGAISNSTQTTGPVTVIGTGSVFVGQIASHGTVEVHGHLKGDVETSGMVVVGEGGIVEGAIASGSLLVRGRVAGTISVKDLAKLSKTARVKASVVAGQLEIEAGAELAGECSVTGTSMTQGLNTATAANQNTVSRAAN